MCDSLLSADVSYEDLEMSRSHNFSVEEIHALLSCLESMKSLIMADGGSEYKTAEEQKKGWEYIACIVNSVGDGAERNAKAVKNKWIDLKYRTKKKVAVHNQRIRTGIGTPSKLKLNEVEERVLRLIGRGSNKGITSFSCALSPDQINALREMSDKDESSTEFEPPEKQQKIPIEVAIQGDRKEIRPSEQVKIKYSSSRDRVRKHRLKVQQQNEDNIEDFIITQKKTYESMKYIEAKTQDGVDNGKIIIRNQEKIINRLDSVVMLMSDLNGHMENLNDSLNILTQVIATKSGIEIVESE